MFLWSLIGFRECGSQRNCTYSASLHLARQNCFPFILLEGRIQSRSWSQLLIIKSWAENFAAFTRRLINMVSLNIKCKWHFKKKEFLFTWERFFLVYKHKHWTFPFKSKISTLVKWKCNCIRKIENWRLVSENGEDWTSHHTPVCGEFGYQGNIQYL